MLIVGGLILLFSGVLVGCWIINDRVHYCLRMHPHATIQGMERCERESRECKHGTVYGPCPTCEPGTRRLTDEEWRKHMDAKALRIIKGGLR